MYSDTKTRQCQTTMPSFEVNLLYCPISGELGFQAFRSHPISGFEPVGSTTNLSRRTRLAFSELQKSLDAEFLQETWDSN